MKNIIALAVLLGCAALFTVQSAHSSNIYVEPSQVLINDAIQVRAGSYSYYELTLTMGSDLVAKFKISGGANNKARVWLLDLDNFQNFKAGKQYKYFEGTSGEVRGIGSYTFKIPQNNVYYLIVDNRGALLLKRQVDSYVYQVLPNEPAAVSKERAGLEKMYSNLKEIYVFDDFRISMRHCGFENAFSNPDITLCRELDNSFQKQQIPGAMVFVFFHELGHTLLKLWGYPGWDNEDVADEFATVLTIIGNSTDTALQAAKWWANSTSKEEALQKLWIDDRHTVSPQRARNIIRWLNQRGELMHRWQKIFIPNMQTAFLAKLESTDASWVDRDLVRAELAKRSVLIAQKSNNTYARAGESVHTKIKEAITSANATRTAISVAVSEGFRLGTLPATPATLGLDKPEAYTSQYVKSVGYDRLGIITVLLTESPVLDDAAGKKIVLVPRASGQGVSWVVGTQTTVPRRYLPDN